MAVAFVHLSDIHFGQERGSTLYIHNDVKEQLLHDARTVVSGLEHCRASGIIVTGDIAYQGKKVEYDAAGDWLDRLAEAVSCDRSEIQLVPGNHDIDRDKTPRSLKLMLETIRNGGVNELDSFLENDQDRETLFYRFQAYGVFSEGYRCPLDTSGLYATNRRVELGSGRAIRFIRINSALLCSGSETVADPELIFGAGQYTIPRPDGEEMIVLCHHPLNWFKDNPDAVKYVKSRARVFMSGHEHEANVSVIEVEPGCDIMLLAAGATVPHVIEALVLLGEAAPFATGGAVFGEFFSLFIP